MQEKTYRFGSCTLRLARRELVVGGVPRLIEPKVLDVLIHLVERHGHVVRKDELLDHVWAGRMVSIGVVARAVMKVREAIEDDGSRPALIKNLPRVGYCFVGEVESVDAPPASSPAPAPALSTSADATGPAAVALALLPFRNATGQAELDWVELGLMSMAAQALAADTRLSLPPIASLLTALGTLPARADPREQEAAVRRLLSASAVVHVKVTRDGDQYALDADIATTPRTQHRRLRGPELTQLGQRLAAEVHAALFAGEHAHALATHESADPLVNQAMARALQAAAEQKWRIAVNLFQVVLDAQPLNQRARLEHLRALAPLGDEAALPLAERLLAQARADGDTQLAMATHAVLGLTYRNMSLYEPAKQHLDKVIAMARSCARRDEEASALNLLAGIAILERDFTRARQILDEAQGLVEACTRLDYVRWLANAALVAAKLGNPLRSVELGRQAARLSREYRLGGNFVIASLNLVNPCFGLGLMREAVEHGEAGAAGSREAGDPFRVAITTSAVCWLYRELRAPLRSQRALTQARAQAPMFDNRSPAPRAALLQAQGHHAASTGEHARAAHYLGEAIAIHREMKTWLSAHETTPWMIISLALAGDAEAALSACAQAKALPGFAGDPDLQAALRYCEALVAHSSGSTADARRALNDVIDTAPMGVWRAYACLDAAWLSIEAGEAAVAQHLLRDLGTWLEEHPVGMVVDARLKYATARYADAHAAQQRHAAMVESALPAYYGELDRIYSSAAAQPPASPPHLPSIPRLPSAL
jgi:DNA-binding winged helix-turn-helix (wHTH) protein/tetratricopeptide (TPR) repeat protein